MHKNAGVQAAFRTGIALPEGLLLDWCCLAVADASVCGEGSLSGVGQGAEVLLGGGDLAVAEAFLDDGDVGAAGEEPGGVGGAQVVEGDFLFDLGCGDGGCPELGAEGVPGDRSAGC